MEPDPGRNDNNRLRLNFPFDSQNNYDSSNNRVYPTTPSTFPQPIYNTAQQDYLGSNLSPNPLSGGYFANNAYPAQQHAPFYNQGYQYQQANNLQSPQPAYQAGTPRAFTNQAGGNDATNGLIQQFSNQDLSGASRAAPYNRTPSPSVRSRTAGTTNQAQQQQQQQHANHLVPPVPSRSPRPAEEDEQQNPRKYSDNVLKRGTAAKQLVNSFFQENIERARDRNTRAKELDAVLKDPSISDARKQQEIKDVAQKEARFLRFLRSVESPGNFQTIKVIGKGAFGEVKLVQRKTDGKIYALKSLIKAEMFRKDQLAHVRAERDILADSKDNPWLVKLHASFQDSAYLYMLMEFLPGGDLMTMLIKYEIFSEDITRFYMAEIVMAIEAVHKLGFLHRYVPIAHRAPPTRLTFDTVISNLTISCLIVVVTSNLPTSVSLLADASNMRILTIKPYSSLIRLIKLATETQWPSMSRSILLSAIDPWSTPGESRDVIWLTALSELQTTLLPKSS